MTDHVADQVPVEGEALTTVERSPIARHAWALLTVLATYAVVLPLILTVFRVMLLWLGWGDIREVMPWW